MTASTRIGLAESHAAAASTSTVTRTPLRRGLVSFFLVAVGDGWCGEVGVHYAPAPPALPILGDGL